jgi:hypothetical protein
MFSIPISHLLMPKINLVIQKDLKKKAIRPSAKYCQLSAAKEKFCLSAHIPPAKDTYFFMFYVVSLKIH